MNILQRCSKVDSVWMNNGAGVALREIVGSEVEFDVIVDILLLAQKDGKCMRTRIGGVGGRHAK